MKAYCEFNSEVLENALYEIMGYKFKFSKRQCLWECNFSQIPDLIRLIEKAINCPKNYNTPPIRVYGSNLVIQITEDKNHLCMNKELMIKFLEELKMTYEVYKGTP